MQSYDDDQYSPGWSHPGIPAIKNCLQILRKPECGDDGAECGEPVSKHEPASLLRMKKAA
jgi:hypothetical protein